MTIEIRTLPRDEVGQICELFTAVYGQPINTRHWSWKYYEGPRLGSVNLTARNSSGEWVGHIGASVFPGSGAQGAYALAQICDVMVKREARGGLGNAAVYPLLVRALQQELKANFANVFAYGFPGLRPFRLGERLGFYRSIYRCETFQTSHVRPSFFYVARWSARPVEWREDLMERIWQRYLPSASPLQVRRTGAFMIWRYRDHPDRNYQLWILRASFRDVGWLVTSSSQGRETLVVDALIPSAEAATAAISALGRALIDRGSPVPVVIRSWIRQSGSDCQETPVMATEFKVDRWQTSIAPPVFQPGDTDVY